MHHAGPPRTQPGRNRLHVYSVAVFLMLLGRLFHRRDAATLTSLDRYVSVRHKPLSILTKDAMPDAQPKLSNYCKQHDSLNNNHNKPSQLVHQMHCRSQFCQQTQLSNFSTIELLTYSSIEKSSSSTRVRRQIDR